MADHPDMDDVYRAAEAQRDLEPKAHPEDRFAPEVQTEGPHPAGFLPTKPAHHSVCVDVLNGVGRVLVDGTNVAAVVTGVTTFSFARHAPKVVLELIPGKLWVNTDRAQVEIDGDTHDLLVSLGWTPPKPSVANGGKDVQDSTANRSEQPAEQGDNPGASGD